jgi:uncharacterized protein YukE
MKREAEQLGLVIGGDFASNSEKLNDNLSRLQKNIDGVANVLAARLVPAFNAVIERVLAATKTFSGFGEFISVSLGAKAFSNEADGVAFYTQRVAELGQEIARLKASGGLLDSLQISGAEKDLDKARKLLEFYQRVASAQGTLGAGGGRGSVVPPAAVRLAGTLPAIPGKADKFKPNDFSDLGSGFGADVGFSQELAPGLQAALRAIESADVSKIAALREQLAELLGLQAAGVGGAATAEAIDATRKALEELDPAAQKAAEQAQRLQDILSQTPGAALQSALQDIELINAAFAQGQVDVDQWAQAVTVATQNLRGAGEAIEEANTFAKDLGMTFSSAFEDAVVGGKKLREVLSGLGQDIIRILLRRNVTGPLANAIGSADFGSIFSSIFSNLPSFDVGTDYVPRDMVAKVHKGERIIPAAQNGGSAMRVVNNIKVETLPGETAQVSQRQNGNINDVLVRIVRQTMRDDVANKGPISRDLAGTFGLNRASGAPRRS